MELNERRVVNTREPGGEERRNINGYLIGPPAGGLMIVGVGHEEEVLRLMSIAIETSDIYTPRHDPE